MSDWVTDLFIDHSDLFLKLLNSRWDQTPELAEGMVNLLKTFNINSGNLLDICCGNGRISIHLAKRGFKAVGVDISETFILDAQRRAKKHRVSDMTIFLKGDVRRLKEVVGSQPQPFDVVVNSWTSIGYYSREDDLNVFRQARELSKEGAILFVAETMHSEYLSSRARAFFTSFMELEDVVLLERRKHDPIRSKMETSWAFYRKDGNDLKFLDRVEFHLQIYSPSELCNLLSKAGWETVAMYGNLLMLQPKSVSSHLNIVAKAM